jgi:hypothetical protein
MVAKRFGKGGGNKFGEERSQGDMERVAKRFEEARGQNCGAGMTMVEPNAIFSEVNDPFDFGRLRRRVEGLGHGNSM